MHRHLKLWPQTFAISRLAADAPIPDWYPDTTFCCLTRTEDELSIICEQQFVPDSEVSNRNWRMLQFIAQMDFSLVGIVAAIASQLADAEISIFTLSTYDTDYILIKAEQIEKATEVLGLNGYAIQRPVKL